MQMVKSEPLAIDLFCGLGGWTEALLDLGYFVVGFDIEQHVYGEQRYPAQLVIQDVLTLDGAQFKDAALIVASPPCQEYSYMAMPWSIAKAKARAIRADETGAEKARLNRLFDACFRIQREACAAAGRHIPLVVENVRGAQEWVGRARWNYGSFYLWGDVPALMPPTLKAAKVPGFRFDGSGKSFQTASVEGTKTSGHANKRDGHGHTRHLTNQAESDGLKRPGIDLSDVGFNVANARSFAHMVEGVKIKRSEQDKRSHIGVTRKFASAMIAKIPTPLAKHIGATYWPTGRAP